jgi:hypothetical protein
MTRLGLLREAQPSIDPKQIRYLAASRWIANDENVPLLGSPDVGKTHQALRTSLATIVTATRSQMRRNGTEWLLVSISTAQPLSTIREACAAHRMAAGCQAASAGALHRARSG